jgi:curved DNA-binding protein CbpA
VRIPLDYYRILSVPVKANSAQLEQAYHDRLLQQPRREYSEDAVAARQQLIQYSYQVLSSPEQRASYDAQFLLNMQPLATPEFLESNEGGIKVATSVVTESAAESDADIDQGDQEKSLPAAGVSEEISTVAPANPTIDIAANQIVGALLILHELGEYEIVLSLGIDDFNRREAKQRSLVAEDELSLDTTQEDLILVLALAYMELGREQWHRREYENAALSAQLGVDLLQQKSLFPHLQLELEQDLAKLRPYRVLELISQNPANSAARTEGFALLQSMLMQRQGIEGKGEDRSGLNFEQFLRFIQQLRTYLTSSEQQQLFDNDSQSKSAIANYLAVYALLGRGFCLKQPELILRAQRKLDYLSEKQDVSWEQSIAALLLGHTEKAIHKLRKSPDASQLQQVEQHALGNSDLLPGLCVYGEQWLLQDVIAQFSDLATTELTLKEYFADQQVQTYLEELILPTIEQTIENPDVVQPPTVLNSVTEEETSNSKIMSLWRNIFSSEKPKTKAQAKTQAKTTVPQVHSLGSVAREQEGSPRISEQKGSSTATIERYPAISDATSSGLKFPPESVTVQNNQQNNQPKKPRPQKSLSLPLEPKQTRAVPESVMGKVQGKTQKKTQKKAPGNKRKKRSSQAIWQGWLFVASLILGVGTLSYLGAKAMLSPPSKTAQDGQLAITLHQPSVKLPPPKTQSAVAKSKPTPAPTITEQSRQAIQAWLTSKSAAFGKEHQIDSLNSILAEPLLTTWRDRAKTYQQENVYREYRHEIVMRSAKIDPQDQNKATVEAEVKETAKHYQSGQLDNAQSYDDNLLVRYQLTRQGEKWLIQATEVLKTL